MEAFALLGFLFGLKALEENRREKEDREYQASKEDWSKNSCSKGQHFVAAHTKTKTRVWCEACELQAILRNKNDSDDGWKFDLPKKVTTKK